MTEMNTDHAINGADAVWHMGALTSACGTHPLKLHGDVRVGQALRGEDGRASRTRGGDACVAAFAGGYMVLGSRDGGVNLDGLRAYTVCIRACDRSPSGNAPILSLANSKLGNSGILYGSHLNPFQIGFRERARLTSDRALEFLHRTEPLARRTVPAYMRDDPTGWFKYLTTNPIHCSPTNKEDFIDGRLRLSVPVDLIGPAGWHDVIIRFSGHLLEMFVDGVLVDEEWPHGLASGLSGPLLLGAVYEKGNLRSGFHGQIDHVAIWRRALTDAEVADLSGGVKSVSQRETAILGPIALTPQYWRPRGHNAFAGDCMAFSHEGRFHIFYLFDRRHTQSKWGMGAHQFAHWSSNDLRQWEHHPMAIPITDPIECAIGTGCCVFHQGQYYLFYIQHAKRCLFADAPYQGDNIFVATSRDGIHFDKRADPVVRLNYGEFRDVNPHVFADAAQSRFYMTVAGWKIYVSGDLLHWTEIEQPALAAIRWICTSNIEWNGWHYFIGCGNYRMSRKPLECAEFVVPATDGLRDPGVSVPTAAPFKDGRYLYAGFVGDRWGIAPVWAYGNELVVREIVQEQDGTLGLKWPEEMIPEADAALPLTPAPLKGPSVIIGDVVQLSGKDGLAVAMLSGLPQNYHLKVRIRWAATEPVFGLCFRGEGSYDDGCELRFSVPKRRVQFDRPLFGSVSRESGGWHGIDYPLARDGVLDVEAIVKDDLVDICIDQRRTLITRNTIRGNRLFLFTTEGEVTFDTLEVRPIL